MKASYSSVALHIANLGGQIGMSGLECGGRQPQAVLLGWRSQCLSASSTGLSVSGQAGLHGNVLQSFCLLAAFCWSKCEADGGETTKTNHPLLLGPAPPVQALLSSLLNTQLCFHTLEGPWASLFQRRGHDKGNCDVPSCSLLAFVLLVFLAYGHFSQEHW